MKTCLISGLALPFFALTIIIISYLMMSDFYFVRDGLLAMHGTNCCYLNFKELIIPLLYFVLLHFSLFLVLKGIHAKIKLNSLSKSDVYRIWSVFLFAIIFGFILLLNGLDFSMQYLPMVNVNIYIKSLIFIGFLISLAGYALIDKVYLIYLDGFVSCCSNQLKALKLQARLLKRMSFLLVILTGWMFFPVLYMFYLYKKALKLLQ